MTCAQVNLSSRTIGYLVPLMTQVYPCVIPEQFQAVLQDTIKNPTLFGFDAIGFTEAQNDDFLTAVRNSKIVRYSLHSSSKSDSVGNILLNLLLKDSDGSTHFLWTHVTIQAPTNGTDD